jgi:hypothetical protein
MKDKLSNVPSEILTQALHDLAVVEKRKGFKIYMNDWMTKDTNKGICEVCLAGAVMVNTLGVNSPESGKLDYFKANTPTYKPLVSQLIITHNGDTDGDKLTTKLRFLNDMREGNYEEGFDRLARAEVITKDTAKELGTLLGSYYPDCDEQDFSDYDNKDLFINHICAVIGTLQAHGA